MADVVASRTAFEGQVTAVRTEAEEEVVAALAEAEKAAEDEFEAGFFQGYTDLKRRVALAYPEWDLSPFSGVD